MATRTAAPRPALGTLDVVAITVGVVVGAGIFRFPSLVAMNVASEGLLIGLWVLGGVISMIGALCYSELATTYPSTGGDYHFLRKAYGNQLSFLFAWARMTVIQTGSIALGAFLIGDYLTQIYAFGPNSSAIYAASVIVLVTGLNVLGIHQGRWTQNLLTLVTIGGLLAVTIIGISSMGNGTPVASTGTNGALGMAMVFILLTYGGWNEAAYISGEVRNRKNDIVRALIWGILLITLLYVLINFALVRSLGIQGMAESKAVAADLMRISFGESGAVVISLLIAVAALSTTNATVITGARTNYALGRDYKLLGMLGRWQDRGSTPMNALLVQGGIALALVVLGAMTDRSGFETMVDYTAPVFWFFFALVGVSVIVLRKKEPNQVRPFRVPLYPLTPLLFVGVCLYMLYSSLAYTGLGALVGVAVLIAGVPLMLLARAPERHEQQTMEENLND